MDGCGDVEEVGMLSAIAREHTFANGVCAGLIHTIYPVTTIYDVLTAAEVAVVDTTNLEVVADTNL